MKVKITQAELDDITERFVVDPDMLELLDEWWISAGYGGDADDLRSHGPRAASYRDSPEDFEDLNRAQQREFALWLCEQSQRRPVYTNPEIYEGPDVSDYEGMKVQFIPGEFKFPQVRASLDFVKFAEDLGLFADVRERVYAVYLNQKNRILGYRLVGSGDVRSSIASPVIIFGPAMILHAAGFAVLHNHPSRELDPSPEDKALAKRLIAGSELLSIHMLDFVVVGGNQYFSFRDEMPDLWQR